MDFPGHPHPTSGHSAAPVACSVPLPSVPPGSSRVDEFARFLRTETVGGILLLIATAVALIWANSPIADGYAAVRDYRIGPAALHLHLAVGTWASDGLLAVFFFVAGLELKRELVVGELADRRSATLPIVAALGGMLVPACLALAVSAGAPGAATAWAIPVATDIAFALGVLALTGSGLPSSARIFLLSLAVVDDLGAILLIAVLFTSGVHLLALVAAVLLGALYWWLQRRRIRSAWVYLPIAALTWYAVHEAGVHATVAGIALGLLTRVRPDPGEAQAPALRLEHRIQPFSSALAVPVFAVFAAGVPIGVDALAGLAGDRIALGVMAGLLAGKVIGIFGFCWVAIRIGIAARPRALAWGDVLAVAVLGGVGFTVSLLIAELALAGAQEQRAKAAVLLASASASLVGAVALLHRSRVHHGGAIEPGRRSHGTMTRVTRSTHRNGRHAKPESPPRMPSLPLSPEPAPEPGQTSLGDLVREATTHLSTLLRSELELAKAELTAEVRKAVKGSLFFIVALAILIFSLVFLFIALGEVLDIWLPRSAAFSIIFAVMVVAAAVCALLGWRRMRSIRKPERTISSVRETGAALTHLRATSLSDGQQPDGQLRGGRPPAQFQLEDHHDG